MSGYNAVLARNTDKAPKLGPYSQTVAFSHYNNLSAQLPVDPKTGKLVCDCVVAQAEQCFNNIKAVVESIDHVMSDVVRISVFVTNIKDVDAVDRVFKTFFPTYVPARTTVAVDALPMGAKVQVEALVSNGEGTIPNAPQSGDLIKLTNNTKKAPLSCISTQTVAFSHYNNITAQLPIDPKSGKIVTGGVKEQAAQCLANVKAILESIDVPFDDIVKVTIFVTNIADIEAVKEVYTTFFPDTGIARAVGYFPALTIVPAKALPMLALVQVEAVVSHGDGTPPQAVEDRHGIIIEANNTDKAPICPFATQTVAFSHYNNISGQCAPGVGDVKAQTEKCLNNIKAIVESVDHVLEDVVKVNIFLKNIADIAAVDEVYAKFFPNGTPARKVVGVGALPKDAAVLIDAIVGNAEGTPPIKK